MTLLFRKDETTEAEFIEARNCFNTAEFRTDVKNNELVIGRYSVLPFYKELELELAKRNSKLVNTFIQHTYIANFEYYRDIKDLTPKTYFPGEFEKLKKGQYIVKGVTNSRKNLWDEQMFAPNLEKVKELRLLLAQDSLIGAQGTIVREFVPLKSFGTNIGGMPISNEWRCFFVKEKVVSTGFYWSNFIEKSVTK